MNSSTINTSTFTLSSSGSSVSGTVSYSNKTATFTPSGNLSYSITYTAKITTGVKDIGGNAMSSNYTWSFTTSTATTTPTPTPLPSPTLSPSSSGTWTQLIQNGTSIGGMAYVYDSNRNRGVIFGGDNSSLNQLNGTYEWNGTSWTLITSSGPSSRVNTAIVFDTM